MHGLNLEQNLLYTLKQNKMTKINMHEMMNSNNAK